MEITRDCKRCKARFIIDRRINIKDKNFKNYCLECWIYLDKEKCREERRIALGLKNGK